MPAVAIMIRCERWAGQESFDAARPTAIAGWSRDLVRPRPWQWVVTPFSRNRIGAGENPLPDGDAAADPGAENDAEDVIHPGPRTIGRFRQGKAIGVVGQADRAVERGLEIILQRPPDQAGGIGILDHAGAWGNGSRHANPDGCRLADLALDLGDETPDRLDRSAIVPRGGRNPATDANGR